MAIFVRSDESRGHKEPHIGALIDSPAYGGIAAVQIHFSAAGPDEATRVKPASADRVAGELAGDDDCREKFSESDAVLRSRILEFPEKHIHLSAYSTPFLSGEKPCHYSLMTQAESLDLGLPLLPFRQRAYLDQGICTSAHSRAHQNHPVAAKLFSHDVHD